MKCKSRLSFRVTHILESENSWKVYPLLGKYLAGFLCQKIFCKSTRKLKFNRSKEHKNNNFRVKKIHFFFIFKLTISFAPNHAQHTFWLYQTHSVSSKLVTSSHWPVSIKWPAGHLGSSILLKNTKKCEFWNEDLWAPIVVWFGVNDLRGLVQSVDLGSKIVTAGYWRDLENAFRN